MNNRFTIKDFFLFALLIGVIVTICFSMAQFNYQEDALLSLRGAIQRNTKVSGQVLSAVQKLERGGIRLGDSAGPRAAAKKIIRKHYKDGAEYVYYPTVPLPPHAAQNQPGYARGDWLVVNLGSEPKRIMPYVPQSGAGQDVQGGVLEPLLTRNPVTLQWEPFLAESYRISANGMKITYKLRRHLTFSDGSALTAKDVVFSYDTLMNPKIMCAPLRSYFDFLKNCKAVGNRTVVFTCRKPYFKALQVTGTYLSIIPRKIYAFKHAETFNTKETLVGSGPYVLHKWVRGQEMIFTLNIHYWGPKPTFNRIIYKFIESPQASLQAFEGGQIDMDSPTPQQWVGLSKRPKQFNKYIHYKYANPENGYSYIGYNLLDPMFKDRKTRTALTMLLDRKAIIKTFLKNLALPVNGPFSPGTPQYSTQVKAIPYDPAGAERLLAQAGWKKNANGFLVRNGKVFHFKLSMPAHAGVMKRIAIYAKQQFAKAGIRMTINGLIFPALVSKIRHRKFDAIYLAWSGGVEQDPMQIWDGKSIANQGSNAISFNNAQANRLIAQGRREMNTAKRMAIWHKLQALIYYQQPYTFLTEGLSLHLINRRFHNTKPFKYGLDTGNWFVPLADQKYH